MNADVIALFAGIATGAAITLVAIGVGLYIGRHP